MDREPETPTPEQAERRTGWASAIVLIFAVSLIVGGFALQYAAYRLRVHDSAAADKAIAEFRASVRRVDQTNRERRAINARLLAAAKSWEIPYTTVNVSEPTPGVRTGK